MVSCIDARRITCPEKLIANLTKSLQDVALTVYRIYLCILDQNDVSFRRTAAFRRRLLPSCIISKTDSIADEIRDIFFTI